VKVDLDPDWTEFLSALIGHRVRFVLVGGHAVAGHGEPRFTEDLDVRFCDEASALGWRQGVDDPAPRAFGLREAELLRAFLDPVTGAAEEAAVKLAVDADLVVARSASAADLVVDADDLHAVGFLRPAVKPHSRATGAATLPLVVTPVRRSFAISGPRA
jgi:hypothetical protein